MLKPSDFFNIENYEHKNVFYNCDYVWQAISQIGKYIFQYSLGHEMGIFSEDIQENATVENTETIYIGEGTVVEAGAYIQGPAVIGKNCQIRSGAYIRGNVIIGDNCIVGHCSELKNCIMLNGSQAPHFNYCGDSILGNKVNLGCGTVLSNLPLTSKKDPLTEQRDSIILKIGDKEYNTGLAKLGAIIGDNCKTGCNAVLNPGTIIGVNSIVYPQANVRKGYYGDKSVIK